MRILQMQFIVSMSSGNSVQPTYGLARYPRGRSLQETHLSPLVTASPLATVSPHNVLDLCRKRRYDVYQYASAR